MKITLVLVLAVIAMSYGQGQVTVVDNPPQQGQIIDSTFYQPSNPGYTQNGYDPPQLNNPGGVQVVDNSGYQPSNPGYTQNGYDAPQPNQQPGLQIVDQGFYRPSNPPSGISIGPTFVDNSAGPNQNRPYPYKQYDNPYARGGK